MGTSWIPIYIAASSLFSTMKSNAQIGLINLKSFDDYGTGNKQYHLPPGYILINGMVMDTNHLMVQYKTQNATEYRFYQDNTNSEEPNQEVQFTRSRHEAGWRYVIFEDPLERHGTGHVIIMNKITGYPVNVAENRRLENAILYKMNRIRVKDNFHESLEFLEYSHHDSNKRLDFGHEVPYSKSRISSPYNYLPKPAESARPKDSIKPEMNRDAGSNNIEDTDDEDTNQTPAPFDFEDDNLKAPVQQNFFMSSDLTNDKVVKRDDGEQFDSALALTSLSSTTAPTTMQQDAVAPKTPLIESNQQDLIFENMNGAKEVLQQTQETDPLSDQTATSPMVNGGSWNNSKSYNNIPEEPNPNAYGSDSWSWNGTSNSDSLNQDEESVPKINQDTSLLNDSEQQRETAYNPTISTTEMQPETLNSSISDTNTSQGSSTAFPQTLPMENIDGRRFTRSIQPEEILETQTPPFKKHPAITGAVEDYVAFPIRKKSEPLKIMPVKNNIISLGLPNKADGDMLLKMIKAIVDSYKNYTDTKTHAESDIGYLSTLLAQKGIQLKLNPAIPTYRPKTLSTDSASIEDDMRKVTGKVIYIADRDGPLPYNENEPLLFTGSYFDI